MSLSSGGYVIVWKCVTDTQVGICSQVFNKDGTKNGSQSIIATFSPSADLWYLKTTALEQGGYVVAWTRYDYDDEDLQTFCAVFEDDGSIRVKTFQVGLVRQLHTVVGLKDGGFVILCDNTIVYLFEADGKLRRSPFRVSDDNTLFNGFPPMAPLSDGGFVVLYIVDQTTYAQRISANGTKQGAPITVDSNLFLTSSSPMAFPLQSDGFMVMGVKDTFQSGENTSGPGRYQRYVRIYKDNQTTPVTVLMHDDQNYRSYFGAMAILNSGRMVASWMVEEANGRAFHGQVFDDSGKKFGSEFVIPLSGDFSMDFYPYSLAPLPDGGFTVVWSYDGSEGVFGQMYNEDGSPRDDVKRISNPNKDKNAGNPNVAILKDGGFSVTWMVSNGLYTKYYPCSSWDCNENIQKNLAPPKKTETPKVQGTSSKKGPIMLIIVVTVIALLVIFGGMWIRNKILAKRKEANSHFPIQKINRKNSNLPLIPEARESDERDAFLNYANDQQE